MPSDAQDLSLPTRSTPSVPRAVWVGGGLLSLVTAGLAGALITRSLDSAPTPAPTDTAVSSVAAQPVPHTAPAPTKPAQRATPATPATTNTAARASWQAPGGTTRAEFCASCGIVESVNAVQQKGQGTGLGAVAGGVLGGVVGNQVGDGKGKTAMTVLGAIGGGVAGHEVEKRVRSETVFNVHVRMEDGSSRVFQRPQSMAVGTRVVVDGTTLRVARDTPRSDEPQTLRTSAPVSSGT